MMYEKVETYKFNTETELEAYREFKRDLKESWIPFQDIGGTKFATIVIRTQGIFDKEPIS